MATEASGSGPTQVLPGVFHWSVRVAGGSEDACAFVREGRVVLVDPGELSTGAIERIGVSEAVVITAAHHSRAAFALRRRLGVPLYAPEGMTLEEDADHRYGGGDLLPGGLMAFHAPAEELAQHVLWSARPVAVVYLSDLVRADVLGGLRLSAGAGPSLFRVVQDLPFVAALMAHGRPLVDQARERLVRLLSPAAGANP